VEPRSRDSGDLEAATTDAATADRLNAHQRAASAVRGSFVALRGAIVERRAKSSLEENLTDLELRFEKGY
jgi:hypothetical protein